MVFSIASHNLVADRFQLYFKTLSFALSIKAFRKSSSLKTCIIFIAVSLKLVVSAYNAPAPHNSGIIPTDEVITDTLLLIAYNTDAAIFSSIDG